MERILLALALFAGTSLQTFPEPPFEDNAAIPFFRKADPNARYFRTLRRARVNDALDLLILWAGPKENTYSPSYGGFA